MCRHIKWTDELCKERRLDAGGLSELSGVLIDKIKRILAKRWTPSYIDRVNIAAVFGKKHDEICWTHEVSVQNIKGCS